ncbi:MAG: phosphodiesterase [Gammaproteobacteria bacterium]|nr:phosphodiesterase [Gammaproteobacteria bacterium]
MAFAPRTLVIALTLATALCGAGTTLADTLLVEGVTTARQTAGERPARGSSMASVEARFGAPGARSSAVGKPPITRWDYPDFVVFFEHDHVVHSVRRPNP